MVPLPQPPGGYETSLKLTSIPAGSQWWRTQHCRHASALFWGRQLLGRWNDPKGRFGRLWVERDLQILDFTGPALQALNLDARLLHSCDALEVCQHWARWVHGAPE